MRDPETWLPWALAVAWLALGVGGWSVLQAEEEDEPVTCAECVEAEDCNRLCGVGPCEACGQRGCWMPEDLNCNAKVRP